MNWLKSWKLLKENGINAVTYKGPVLASQAYGNIGLREFGDIDIFINKKDALKVKKIMIYKGYELYPPLDFEEDELLFKIHNRTPFY